MLAGVVRFAPSNVKDCPRVLCYHRVEPEPRDRWSVSVQDFAMQMRCLRTDWNPVGLSDVAEWLDGNRELAGRSVVVTFDDGFMDVFKHALPVLDRYSIPATMFVCPRFVEIGDGERDSGFEAEGPFMGWKHLEILSQAGCMLGSHSQTHPVLSRLDEKSAREEIAESRRQIESATGKPCRVFCYPYGTPAAVSEREWALVEEAGYTLAFSSVTGALSKEANRWYLPRSKVLAGDKESTFMAILEGRLDAWRHIERRH